MTNNYYYKNREERIEYQRKYRVKQKYNLKNFRKVKGKYKKKPKEKTKIIIKRITVNFD